MYSSFILKVLMLICMVKVKSGMGQSYFSKAKLHPKCLKIGPTRSLDMEWAAHLFSGDRFYISLGSMSGFADLGYLLKGREVRSERELDDLCPHVDIKAFKSTTNGYDGHFLVLDCALIRKGVTDCRANKRTQDPQRHQTVHWILTLAWTDNIGGFVLVRCSSDGDKNDWFLYTKSPNPPSNLTNTVTKVMARLGFNKSLYTPIFNNCNFNYQNTSTPHL